MPECESNDPTTRCACIFAPNCTWCDFYEPRPATGFRRIPELESLRSPHARTHWAPIVEAPLWTLWRLAAPLAWIRDRVVWRHVTVNPTRVMPFLGILAAFGVPLCALAGR